MNVTDIEKEKKHGVVVVVVEYEWRWRCQQTLIFEGHEMKTPITHQPHL